MSVYSLRPQGILRRHDILGRERERMIVGVFLGIRRHPLCPRRQSGAASTLQPSEAVAPLLTASAQTSPWECQLGQGEREWAFGPLPLPSPYPDL